jgi:hypothetical protein
MADSPLCRIHGEEDDHHVLEVCSAPLLDGTDVTLVRDQRDYRFRAWHRSHGLDPMNIGPPVSKAHRSIYCATPEGAAACCNTKYASPLQAR